MQFTQQDILLQKKGYLHKIKKLYLLFGLLIIIISLTNAIGLGTILTIGAIFWLAKLYKDISDEISIVNRHLSEINGVVINDSI